MRTTKEYMFTATHGHSQRKRNHQCVVGLLARYLVERRRVGYNGILWLWLAAVGGSSLLTAYVVLSAQRFRCAWRYDVAHTSTATRRR
ncbi:hypothetical protein EVAR_41651_1 [Eumeta japonica]|uniref:Uncharacterized protein n=1 Tax=Eumeta variegata TaxID=151549 RepID=A0A4C1X1R1_EUMVA|nr:hypothetical protein EVAR_41651_1 [Eumeta japonica]